MEHAAASCAASDLTTEAARTARAAHGGWHSPRTDRRADATCARLWRAGFDPVESVEAFRRDRDAEPQVS